MNNNQNQFNSSNNNQNLYGNNSQTTTNNVNLNNVQPQYNSAQQQYNNMNTVQPQYNTNTINNSNNVQQNNSMQPQYNNLNTNQSQQNTNLSGLQQQYSNNINTQQTSNNLNTVQSQYNSSNINTNFNQQTIPNDNVVKPTSSFEPLNSNDNNSNNDSNNNFSKKNNNKIIPIIIIALVVIVGIILLVSLLNKKNNDVNKENKGTATENINSSGFVTMAFSKGKYFIGLTADGNIYQIGKLNYGGQEYKTTTKIASNVKKAYFGNYNLYINNKNEVYHMGLGLNGGTSKEFKKIFDNAKDVTTNGFTVFVVDNNNNLYVRHNPFGKSFACGFKEYYTSEFVKVKESVKAAYPGTSNYYYITLDNKLYVNNGTTDELIMENVKEINDYSYGSKIIIIDNNNTAHQYNNQTKQVTKLLDNIIKSDGYYMIDKNHNAYKINERSETGEFSKIEEIMNVSYIIKHGKYTKLKAPHNTYVLAKYIGTDGKIHIYLDGKDNTYTVKNLDDILKFDV